MICTICDLDPCLCAKPNRKAHIYQRCSTAGCNTMIRSIIGSQPTMPVCSRCLATAVTDPPVAEEIKKLVDKLGKRM